MLNHTINKQLPVESTEFWNGMDKNRVGNLLARARLTGLHD